ncbi:MAG: adenylate kinase [Parvularculaceae bacterium]|nr:adenylate kinase [Parvularculaceae bacterium]
MRVVVLGISGSGKTTFATRLAEATGIEQIELDLLSWRPGWVSRYETDFDGLVGDLDAAMQADEWVVAGGYSKLRERTLRLADVVVWLDLPKWLVLWQVFKRSFYRASIRSEMLNGNVETFSRWRSPTHPLQLVWRHYQGKQQQFAATLEQGHLDHLKVYRCHSRSDVRWALSHITSEILSTPGRLSVHERTSVS